MIKRLSLISLVLAQSAPGSNKGFKMLECGDRVKVSEGLGTIQDVTATFNGYFTVELLLDNGSILHTSTSEQLIRRIRKASTSHKDC